MKWVGTILLSGLMFLMGFFLLSKLGSPFFEVLRIILPVVLVGIGLIGALYFLHNLGWLDFAGIRKRFTRAGAIYGWEEDEILGIPFYPYEK